MKTILYIILSLLLFTTLNLAGQEAKKVFHQAMEQEIARNMKDLHLKGMKDPFYIGLNILDAKYFFVHSSLGALIKSAENSNRYSLNSRILVGDFNSNNLNYRNSFGLLSGITTFPLDNSIQAVQRNLWLLFDRGYKSATESFEAKQSAIKSTTQNEDISGLPDFTSSEKVTVEKPETELKFNNEKLVQYSNEISAVFKSYKWLSSSWVRIAGIKGNIYYSNSEGSKATYPSSLIRLIVSAETQMANGEILELYRIYHALNEAGLPTKEQVILDAKAIAETLSELKNAPVFDDVYNGPVLFEDQAAGEVVRKTMFYGYTDNLYSVRVPVSGNSGSNQEAQKTVATDDRIGKKISADGLSVMAKPLLTEFNGIQLIGTIPIDMDGTVPPAETSLIENGILKNLLCGRIPTAKLKSSNGHMRTSYSLNTTVAPGVIEVDFAGGISKTELKKKLMETAISEGLDYALIVREMTPNFSEFRKIYKVDAKTGTEQLVRSAGFKGLKMSDLRKIIGAGNGKMVFNTTTGEDLWLKGESLNGCPTTFISPDAFLFREIEVTKQSKSNMTKLPIVKNPMEL